jgi:hypothetical protein
MEHKFTNSLNMLTVRVQCVLFNNFGCSVCFVQLFWVFSVFCLIIQNVKESFI